MINKVLIKQRFSNSAFEYDKYASVQKDIAHNLFSLFKISNTKFNHILEIGCGTGYLTSFIINHSSFKRFTVTDISPQMINLCLEKYNRRTDIVFSCLDGEFPDFNINMFDLITSSSTFQWFTNLKQAFRDYYGMLTPNGRLVFAILIEGTFSELQSAVSQAGVSQYVGLHYHTENEICNMLSDIGYTDIFFKQEAFTEYHNTSFQFLKAINKIGANTSKHNGNVPLCRKSIRDICMEYDYRFLKDGKVPATYNVLFAEAYK